MLVVVNPAERGAQEVSIPMAERAWREAHTTGAAAQTESGVEPSSAPDVEFELLCVRSAAEAARAIQSALLQLRCRPEGRPHPCACAVSPAECLICPEGRRRSSCMHGCWDACALSTQATVAWASSSLGAKVI